MSDHTAKRVDRIAVAMTIEKALAQCGISVRYAIAGPSELFDVAGIVLDSPAMRAHDADVKAAAWDEASDATAEHIENGGEYGLRNPYRETNDE